ncbi:hypothetical protein H0H93_007867 [Arthromyces matolae]|nr:hypothetical protein H0H93_007867 [Arthromyces matolae]
MSKELLEARWGAIGILDRRDMDHFAEIFLTYQQLGNTEMVEAVADAQGRCLGVFDTVGSFGLPEELASRSTATQNVFGFPDKLLGSHIEYAYQALALNESRADLNCAKLEQTSEGKQRGQTLKQVDKLLLLLENLPMLLYSAGLLVLISFSPLLDRTIAHIVPEIGGGWPDHDLSDLALTWMAVGFTSTRQFLSSERSSQQAQIDSILSLDTKYLLSIFHPVAAWGKQKFHDPRTGIFRLSRSIQRPIPTSPNVVTCESIHASVREQDLSESPELRKILLQQPELVTPLLPLEEEVKAIWPKLLENTPASNAFKLMTGRTTLPDVTVGNVQASENFDLSIDGDEEMTVKDLIEHFEAPSPSFFETRKDALRPIARPVAELATNSGSQRSLGDHPTVPVDLQTAQLPLDSTEVTGATGDSMTYKVPRRLPLRIQREQEPSSRNLEGLRGDRHLMQRHEASYEMTPLGTSRQEYRALSSTAHLPVPATIVFARNAPPLHLPALDRLLSSMPSPGFSRDLQGMFPPMDKLTKLGKSLDDLETNATVPPFWRNRKTLLGSTVNLVLGLTGSSALASYYSLQGLLNTVQVFALILNTIVPVGGNDIANDWRNLFLGTIPNILALNFATTLVESLIFLVIYMTIAAGLLTMAVHVLVWSQDLWVVPNPYANATSYPPDLPPLGPANEYRDPLDFCWTTTMRRNQINYAPFVVILAALVFIFLTMWFPLSLHRAIKYSVPKVDKFTELGRLRNSHEMDEEYHRLINRDENPFSFLYNGMFVFHLSAGLDVTPSSPHTRRRIWQESITTLLLTTSDCGIPKTQSMTYALARDSEFPPYLLGFEGTPGERHVENLKILREIGWSSYNRTAALITGAERERYRWIEGMIQKHFVGPDCFWRNPSTLNMTSCKSYFGNAWWIPFPPTLVLRYDDGPLVILSDSTDLAAYIEQNSSSDVCRRRLVRLSLRALEGRLVFWPYDHISPIGTSGYWPGRASYEAQASTHFRRGVLKIERRGHLIWKGAQLGSGFVVKIRYSTKVLVPSDVIGLDDDYDLTVPLAQFLELNRTLVAEGLSSIENAMEDYRHYHRKVNHRKNEVLSYRFLSDVYNAPQDKATLSKGPREFERDPRVRHLIDDCENELGLAYKRWLFVSQSEIFRMTCGGETVLLCQD